MTTEAQKGNGGDVSTDRGHLALAMPCDPMASPMPWQQVPLARPAPTARPHLARPPVHQGAPLGQRRPARRQPGPHRPDGLRAQARAVPDAGRRRLQGDRGRVPLGQPDRLRLPAPDHRRGADPRRRRDPGAHPVPPGADRAHLRVAAGAHRGLRALLQLGLRAPTARRLRARQGRHHRHRRQGGRAVQAVRAPSSPTTAPSCATSTRPRASPGPSPTSRSRSARRSWTSSSRRPRTR